MVPDALPATCTKRQAAKALGVSLPTLGEMIAMKQLATVTIARCQRIPRWSIEQTIGKPSPEVAGDGNG